MTEDIFLRVHPVSQNERRSRPEAEPKWPTMALVFDTETTTDTRQSLTVGAYRICRLRDGQYVCVDEGLFYGDDMSAEDRELVRVYAARTHPDVRTFPPRALQVRSRADFVERVLFRCIKKGALIVGFNLPFDLSRLAVSWRKGRDGWSLILSVRRSHKTGRIEPNPERPRVKIEARDSKSAFISLTRPIRPEEWPHRARFLDLRQLAFALYDESFSLQTLCERLKIPGKLKHEPTGRVTTEEINYCRRDVRATVGALNVLRAEFQRHPIDLLPDRAYSPASLAKAYFDRMGLIPPSEKFNIDPAVLGIAMQAYYGGRA